MKKLDLDEVKKIELDLLIEFDKICKENDLKYSLNAGTLIGAVRHKGFIPWDDDIDVMMPRDDYEKFVRLKNANDYDVMLPNINYLYPFAKMIRKNTLLIEEGRNEKIGVFIDIFPIDKYKTENEKEIIKRTKKVINLIQLITCKTKTKKIFRRICRNVIRTLLRFFYSKKRILKMINNFNDYLIDMSKDGNFSCSLSWSENPPKNMYGVDIFDSIIKLEFEKYDFSVISKYDLLLKSVYGNYMELPPVEARVPHHDFEAFYLD